MRDGFNTATFFAALDARRIERRLSWPGVARAIWDQSAELNTERDDHPISAATLRAIKDRDTTSCQHALFVLRWLDRSPESFLTAVVPGTDHPLPVTDAAHRLRWHLHTRDHRPVPGLFEAMDQTRTDDGLSWTQLAHDLGCTPSQLTGLARARFAINIGLALRITQYLQRPAADFVYPARW